MIATYSFSGSLPDPICGFCKVCYKSNLVKYNSYRMSLDLSILYTYTVSRVTYTDENRACIWTSLGEFRYERYDLPMF